MNDKNYNNKIKTAEEISKIIGSKWGKKRKQLDLLDSSLFRKYRKYMIYLLKKI